MTNPYLARQPQETAWQNGYDYGFQHAHYSTPEAPDFSSWSHYPADVIAQLPTIWREGADAGRTAALGHAPTGADATDDGTPPDGGVLTPATGNEPEQLNIRVQTVKFWVNAFIHDAHVDGPPGAGITLGYEYFSGDNRGYSTEIHAPHRLHTEIEIVDIATGHPKQSFQWSHCDESHALDSSFNIVATKQATPTGGWGEPLYGGGVVSVHLRAAAAMPLLPSPDVDVNGTFSVNVQTGEVSVNGMIDVYPWFEGYASVNNGAPVTLFQMDPTGSPLTLAGDANRPVQATVQAPL